MMKTSWHNHNTLRLYDDVIIYAFQLTLNRIWLIYPFYSVCDDDDGVIFVKLQSHITWSVSNRWVFNWKRKLIIFEWPARGYSFYIWIYIDVAKRVFIFHHLREFLFTNYIFIYYIHLYLYIQSSIKNPTHIL